MEYKNDYFADDQLSEDEIQGPKDICRHRKN